MNDSEKMIAIPCTILAVLQLGVRLMDLLSSVKNTPADAYGNYYLLVAAALNASLAAGIYIKARSCPTQSSNMTAAQIRRTYTVSLTPELTAFMLPFFNPAAYAILTPNYYTAMAGMALIKALFTYLAPHFKDAPPRGTHPQSA